MIIPTVRNSDELGITLDGLANQTYDDMEVVVVGPRDDKGKMEADNRGFRYIFYINHYNYLVFIGLDVSLILIACSQ